MGQSKPRSNVSLPGDVAGLLSDSGEAVFDCRFTGTVPATPLDGVTSGRGSLLPRGEKVVLAKDDVDIAQLDGVHPLTARLRHCLGQGFAFTGVLRTEQHRALVEVLPAT